VEHKWAGATVRWNTGSRGGGDTHGEKGGREEERVRVD